MTIPNDDRSLRQSLIALLHDLFGARARLKRLDINKRMPDYRVVLVDLDEPPFALVVKMAGPGAELASPFDSTAALLELVRQRGSVPVARPLGVDVSCQRWPWRYLVTTRQPGIQWVKARQDMTETERDNCYAQLGEAVAELHAIQFTGFGELPPSLDPPACGTFLAAWRERAQAFIPDQYLRAAFLAALSTRTGSFADLGHASLCHEDLHGYNILFERTNGVWRLSAILDFDKAWAGCRESDLARLEFWDDMTNPAFWQAYQGSLPIDPGYRQRKLLFQLFWCLEYGETTPRHQADTAWVCRELGIPEIRFSA